MKRPKPSASQVLRMIDLRTADLSYAAIAAVLRLDTGRDFTPDQARYYVRTYGSSEPIRSGREMLGMTKDADRPQQFRSVT